MTIGWAILGTGNLPNTRTAPAIKQAGGELVAVLSRDRQRGEAFAAKHGAKRAYTALDELLRDTEVAAVYVATPNSLHAPQTIQAAEAGKHVLCEKPMALTIPDCQAMIAACRRNGVRLGLGFHLRHHPAHQEIRRLISSGTLGIIAHARAQFFSRSGRAWSSWWRDPEMVGGGVMMGNAVHSIDLLRFLLDKEVDEVTAFTDGQRPEKPLEEHIVALLRFQGEAFAIVESSRLKASEPDNDVVVYGSLGTAKGFGTVGLDPVGKLQIRAQGYTAEAEYHAKDLYQTEIEMFHRAIETGTEPNASGADGLRVAEIALAIFESQKQGRTIHIEQRPIPA